MGSVSRRVAALEAAAETPRWDGPMPPVLLIEGEDGVARGPRGEAVDVAAAAAAWARYGVRVHLLTRAERTAAERGDER